MAARFPAALTLIFICGLIAILLSAQPAQAKDYFLTIGGGYSPAGNQVSLESNVLFLQRTLKQERPDAPPHEIYFADGDAPERDVQYADAAAAKSCPPAARIMTEVFGQADSVGLSYRNHNISDVKGPTERSAISRRFRQLGRELKSGDRLIVYVTGHGSEPKGGASGDDDYDYRYDDEKQEWVASYPDDDDDQAKATSNDTTLFLWNDERVAASEFGGWLDRLPEEVEVVLIMVQCYSGGFAHAIFNQNNADLGLSSRPRCGFFSQVHDRPAAGCTPEMREAEYKEYSTYFWAALAGASRTGEPIDRPDYNGDGAVSFAEAHAYVIVESDTIDIPVCTSEALLRRYSRLPGSPDDDRSKTANPVSEFFSVPPMNRSCRPPPAL